MARVMFRYPEDGQVTCTAPVGWDADVSNADLRMIGLGLPAEVERLRAAGRLSEAVAAIDALLTAGMEPVGVQPELVGCLRAERHRIELTRRAFTVTRAEALATLRAEIPGFSEADLNALIARRRIDWRFIEGEQHFLENFMDSLRVYVHEIPGLAPASAGDVEARDALIERTRAEGGAARRITLRARLEVPGAAAGETVRAWLPVPAACAQQSAIEILAATEGAVVAEPDAPARTVYWESDTVRAFEVTYRYVARTPYVDAYALAEGDADDAATVPAALGEGDVAPEDLAELEPHIVFTPYVRALAARVTAGARTPLAQARALYDYVTANVDYRYQPPYALLDNIADTCAKSLRGDCGVMAATFIALCRAAGVPARWQSGLYVTPDSVSPHDWAQFYAPGMGWLWADCSFGSSARRAGAEKRRRHYFGNLDPWRMVANRAFMAELAPACDGVRWDPCDNQMGEASVDGRGLDSAEMLREVELLSMEELPYA